MFDNVTEQAPGALCEGELVRKAGFQQHANAVVTGHISGLRQRDILTHPEMSQMAQLCQYK